MAERQIGHRKSCLVLSAHFPVFNWRSRPVTKSVYFHLEEGETILARGTKIFGINFREHFHLEEGETLLARGNENFRAPGEYGFSFFQVKMFTESVRVLLIKNYF